MATTIDSVFCSRLSLSTQRILRAVVAETDSEAAEVWEAYIKCGDSEVLCVSLQMGMHLAALPKYPNPRSNILPSCIGNLYSNNKKLLPIFFN